LYSFPINLSTLNQVYGIRTPNEAKALLDSLKIECKSDNFEDWVISQVGIKLYEMFFKNYTEKQWGCKAKDLPSKIAKRIPIRLNYDDNYYNHRFQGIPIGGYNQIIEEMLKDIPVILNFDFNKIKNQWGKYARKLVYTGSLDELYDYQFGELEYRTLRWEHEIHEGDYQGVSVINYCDNTVPYTRIIEHKHFEFGNQPLTIISKEYPEKFIQGKERLYPIDDDKNRIVYKQYEMLAEKDNILLLGRLAKFKYFDMNQVIASVLKACEKEFNGL
jgi:UDP-galactopyranose mutase